MQVVYTFCGAAHVYIDYKQCKEDAEGRIVRRFDSVIDGEQWLYANMEEGKTGRGWKRRRGSDQGRTERKTSWVAHNQAHS